MAGTLFVVATPIGNLEDITARALRVLREVALIAAEDTRRTAHLLARYAITTPTTSLHEHNETGKAAALIERLRRGRKHRAGVGRGNADRLRSRAPPDPRGHRARHPGRADPGAERRHGGAGRFRPPDATASRSLDFHRLGQKTERCGSNELRAVWSGPSSSTRRRIEFGRRSSDLRRSRRRLRQVVGRPRTDQGPRRIGQRTNFNGPDGILLKPEASSRLLHDIGHIDQI